jgi:hypothetical protein
LVPCFVGKLASLLTWPAGLLPSVCAGSSTANLLQALEDYLPVLLGLVKEGEEQLQQCGGLVVFVLVRSFVVDEF